MKIQRHHNLPPLAAASLLGLAATAVLPLAPPAARAQSVTTWAQSYGVGCYDAQGQPDPSTDYGSGSDLPVGIAPMPDGGVVVAGKLDLPEFRSAHTSANALPALVRYDAKGAILWQQLLRQNNDSTDAGGTRFANASIEKLRTDAAGNIFISGSKVNSNGQNLTGYVAKFSPAGGLVWQAGFQPDDTGKTTPPYVSVENDYAQVGGSLDLLPDGGVIVGGSIHYIVNGNNNVTAPFIYKVNADGTIGFQREFDAPYQSSFGITTICRRPDADGYALLLSKVENGEAGVFVILTDAVGNPVSQRILSPSAYGNAPHLITTSADGNFLLSGSLDPNNGNGVEVRKLRPDLTPIWQKLVRHFSYGSYALTPTADGGCILPGQATTLVKDRSHETPVILLLTLDGNGTLTAAHELGGNGGEGATGSSQLGAPPVTCLTTDGGVAFTAATFSYGTGPGVKADWWVVKTNAAGKVPGFADNMLDVPLADFGELDSDEKPSVPPMTPYGPGTVRGVAMTTQPAFVLEDLATETGINKPTVKFQANPVTGSNSTHLPFFAGEAALGNGVFYLQFPGGNPFGYYSFLADPHYIFHQDLGYEYVFDAGDGKNGVFLYDFKSGGFFYTSPAFPFPYLYDFSLNTVLYYFPDPKNPGRYNTDGVRYFSNLSTGQIISK